MIQSEVSLLEIVQLVGKSALGENDKATLDIANLLKNDFLQQNGISEHDAYCPWYKTTWMLSLCQVDRSTVSVRTQLTSFISYSFLVSHFRKHHWYVVDRLSPCEVSDHLTPLSPLSKRLEYQREAQSAISGNSDLTWSKIKDHTSTSTTKNSRYMDQSSTESSFLLRSFPPIRRYLVP